MAFLAFIIEDNPPDVWVAPHSMTGLNPFTRSQVSNAVCAKYAVPKMRLTLTIAVSPFERKKNRDRANVWRTRRRLKDQFPQRALKAW
jgi:hypothetical protein